MDQIEITPRVALRGDSSDPSPGKTSTKSDHFMSMFRKRNSPKLRRRINASKWPERGNGHGCIARRAALHDFRHSPAIWGTEYDWRKVEARLNALPQFITEIDGLDIHFIHVRSKHQNALR